MRSVSRGAILCALPFIVATADRLEESSRRFSLVSAGNGVWAAIARPGDRASLGNAGFVIGAEAVLAVDAFATPEAARELLEEIGKKTPLPVRWLVNTHYHLDHVGGNEVFAKAGAVILAQENVRGWERTQNLKWRKEITPEDRAMLSRLVLPELTYHEGVSIWLGDRRVDVFSRPGHTGGDSVVSVPDARVLFGGDLVWKNTIPNLVDAKTDAWIDTLNGLLRDYPSATVVPGHGGMARPLDVRFFRDYLRGLRLAVARALEERRSGDALREFVKLELTARYGRWTYFEEFADANIAQTEAELTGTKAFPPPP